MKKLLSTIVVMLLPMMASAYKGYDVKINGLYYKLNTTDKTASVACNSYYEEESGHLWYENDYSGDIIIPDEVSYNNVTYRVTGIGDGAFGATYQPDPSITSVTIPNSVTTIGNQAFEGCIYLTSIIIPSSVTSIGASAFDSCSGLTSITIPKSVTSIGENAFDSCPALNSIIVEEGNSVYDSRDNCNALIESNTNKLIKGCKNTIIPNTIKTIGKYAFCGCDGLTSIDIPNGVLSIEERAFSQCGDLTTITIHSSVLSIGVWAFGYCFNLTDYYCYSSNYSLDPGLDNNTMSMTLHVPSAYIYDFSNSNLWRRFSSIVPIVDPGTGILETPTISIVNGILKFDCGTDGADYVYSITYPGSMTSAGNNVQLPQTFTVSVYAVKDGYVNSDTVTKQITITNGLNGDLNGDGTVNVADHVELSNIILGQ